MILTVTCNPAYDVTYRLGPGQRLEAGEVHRVAAVATVPGGKGVNVARVLRALGEPVRAVGLADERFAEAVRTVGVPADFVAALPEVRRTLVVHATTTTSLWEPGAAAAPDAAVRLEALVAGLLPGTTALVVSGSLPPGVDPALPTRLAALARRHGVPAVLDLDGAALAVAAEGGGAVLTPNADELAGLVGPGADPATAAQELAARTGAPVVLTRGAEGLLAATGDEVLTAVPPRRVEGNPTGAGDATAAGIARGLARGWSWPELLPHAIALGAAAVARPTAGEIDLEVYRELLREVAR